MKKLFTIIAMPLAIAAVASCGVSKYADYNSTPEESGLYLTKITDENMTSVVGSYKISSYMPSYDYTKSVMGCSKKSRVSWQTTNSLSLSPDGTKIAHLTLKNNQSNIVIRNVSGSQAETQRTFRPVTDVCWGNDNKLYFSDNRSTVSRMFNICCIPAEQGSLMSQLTNGSVIDYEPATVDYGNNVFFTRVENNGPAIWRYTVNGGALTFCSRGFSPCPIPNNPDAFYCVRNSSEGRSEIWFVDFVKGQEVCVLSDETRGFTQPSLSPDGKWLLCVGNGISSSKKTPNLDIFAVRVNGTGLTQLTNHPDADVSPIWSKDGRYIYFISTRANKDKAGNIWRMSFQQ